MLANNWKCLQRGVKRCYWQDNRNPDLFWKCRAQFLKVFKHLVFVVCPFMSSNRYRLPPPSRSENMLARRTRVSERRSISSCRLKWKLVLEAKMLSETTSWTRHQKENRAVAATHLCFLFRAICPTTKVWRDIIMLFTSASLAHIIGCYAEENDQCSDVTSHAEISQ